MENTGDSLTLLLPSEKRDCCFFGTLLLPAFNLNEPVQMHCSSAPENRMHLCETRGECLMARHPLHSRGFYYKASLHFNCLNHCQQPCTSASNVTSSQHPIRTHTCMKHCDALCLEKHLLQASICTQDMPGDGDCQRELTAMRLFSLSISNI